MSRKIRFAIAAIVTLILVIVATGVWAESKESSLGPIVHDMKQACNTTILMGDATFTITVDEREICSFEVIRLKIPNAVMGSAPAGLEFRSDGFQVIGPDDKEGILEACFAYSPQDADKNAQVYAVFGPEQTILPAVIDGPPTLLCVATSNLSGIFAVVGNP